MPRTVRIALMFVVAAAWLAACSGAPPATDATTVSVVIRLDGAGPSQRAHVAPLGSPFDPGTGASGITLAELTVTQGGTPLQFDADGNIVTENGVPLHLTDGDVTLRLPHGTYDFSVDGRDNDSNQLADGHAIDVAVQADTTLAIALTSFLGDATLLPPHTILPNQVIDVGLLVHPPGRTDLIVPTTDYTATYSSSATIVSESPRGLRLVVECEPIDLTAEVLDMRGSAPITRNATLPTAQICSNYAGSIGVDLIPPYLELDAHPSSVLIGTIVTLTGTVSDAQTGVASIDLYDGPIHLGSATIDDQVIPHTYSLAFVPNEERAYALTLLARDHAGNETQAHTFATATQDTGSVTSVMINEGDQAIRVGDTYAFTATVTSTGAASDSVTWSSTDESVAIIDPTGLATALAIGTTTITATSGIDASVSSSVIVSVSSGGYVSRAGGSDFDHSRGISTLSDGSAVITGFFPGSAAFGDTTLVSNGVNDIFVAKTNPDGTWQWATRAGGADNDQAYGVSTLSDGSAIITGRFNGTANFGSTTVTSTGGNDVFIAKTNADGTWAWATRAGGTGNDVGNGVDTLSDGSAIVTGYFFGAATFGTTTLTSPGFDVFVAKTDPDGTWAWATSAGGTGSSHTGFGVNALSDGSAIITGSFRGTANFGSTTLTSAGNADVFVAKTNPNGSWAWATRAGGADYDYAYGVSTLSDGSAIITGYFGGTADFGTTSLTSTGSNDVFVAKTNPDGTWAWATRGGGTSNDFAYAVSTLSDGSAISTGYFQGSATFGATALASAGNADVYVAKTNPDGTWAWATRAGGVATEVAYGVSVLSDGSSIVSGYFVGTTTFGPVTLSSSGASDIFVAKIDPGGQW